MGIDIPRECIKGLGQPKPGENPAEMYVCMSLRSPAPTQGKRTRHYRFPLPGQRGISPCPGLSPSSQGLAEQPPGEHSPLCFPLFATADRPISGGNPAERLRSPRPLYRGDSVQGQTEHRPGEPSSLCFPRSATAGRPAFGGNQAGLHPASLCHEGHPPTEGTSRRTTSPHMYSYCSRLVGIHSSV